MTRFYPRGVKKTRFDIWVRHASPEATLLKDYKKGLINWREFSKRFREQMRTSTDSKKAVEDLVDFSRKGRSVTLLCYEKEGERCHRYLLKKIVENAARKKEKEKSQSRKL